MKKLIDQLVQITREIAETTPLTEEASSHFNIPNSLGYAFVMNNKVHHIVYYYIGEVSLWFGNITIKFDMSEEKLKFHVDELQAAWDEVKPTSKVTVVFQGHVIPITEHEGFICVDADETTEERMLANVHDDLETTIAGTQAGDISFEAIQKPRIPDNSNPNIFPSTAIPKIYHK